MSDYQNASVTRYGYRAAMDRIATAHISAKVHNTDQVTLDIRLEATHTAGAKLTVRVIDLPLLIGALNDADRAIRRGGNPTRPALRR